MIRRFAIPFLEMVGLFMVSFGVGLWIGMNLR